MARVGIENLTKIFARPGGETIRAVHNASLAIEEKELLVLVGPSGCGKTTALRLIAGLEEPTTGTVSIDGEVVNDMEPKDRDIAMVFQNYALYPHMSVYENMAFGLKLRKVAKSEIERRVCEAAEMLDLADCLERRPQSLSGGQRQRVALGRALVRRPKVILLDEPLSSLDARLRAQVRSEIARLQARLGLTMLYVTHDQLEAMTLGGRIAVMKEGTIQQVAGPMQLYEYPGNRFVAGFFGSPPMNFFHGTIIPNGSGLMFQEQLLEPPPTPSPLTADEKRSAHPAQRMANAGPMISVRLAQETMQPMREYVGKQIVLGIRPEHIKAAPRDTLELRVEAILERVELLGSETHLHLAGARHSFIARVPAAHRVTVNQRVPLVFEMGHAHFFDLATERRIG